MFRYRIILILSCLGLLAALGVSAALAQDEATCTALMQEVITQTTTQCATAGANTVCYGHHDATGSFRVETEPVVFTNPGDVAGLLMTEAIQTGPLDMAPDPDVWGMAVMNVQAGLPAEVLRANGGKGAIYILLGGVEVENGVEPENVLALPDQPLSVSTIGDADLRMSPVAFDTPTGSNVIGRVPSETALNADAVSADGQWVRVVHNGQAGWISSATLQPTTDLSSLPAVGPDSFTPMQSFYFHNDVDSTTCADVPSLLLVQGPENTPVYLRVHGVDIRIESSALFRSIPGGPRLGESFEIITLFGMVTVFPDTVNQLYIPPGFVGRFQLGTFTSLGIQGDDDERSFVGVAGPIRPLTPGEINLFRFVRFLPRNILHYLIDLPRYISPSGVGQALHQLIFDNPAALRIATILCQNGRLPDNVCAILGL